MKAALVCGIIYNVLYLLLYCFMPQLFEVLDPVFWKVTERSAFIGGSELQLRPFIGTVIFAVIRFAVFIGLWLFINTMTEHGNFGIAGGVLLAVYSFITPVIGKGVYIFELRYASSFGSLTMTARTLYDRVFYSMGFLFTASEIILFMAFAMLWHKNAQNEDNLISYQ